MDTNRALGIAGILIIIVAAAVAGYLLIQDNGNDEGEGANYQKVALEYVAKVSNPQGTWWDLDIEFNAPEGGSYRIFIGDEPLLNGAGEQVSYSWSGSKHVDISYSFDSLRTGFSYSEAQSNLNVEFSFNFDATRVSSL